MDRIVHSSAVDIGGGRRGFRSKDTVAGLAGTVVTAGHMNATQEEMVAVIEKAGLIPDAGDLAQLVKAIRSQHLNFVPAAQVAGSANAVTLAFTPEFGALSELVGVPIVHLAEADNTGPMTVKVDSLALVARTWADGTPLAAGDVKAGRLYVERFDGTAFRLEGSRSTARLASALAEKQPVYPEITSANAVFTFAVAAGQVTIASGAWQHRGLISYDIAMFSAPEITFVTAANRTYHLRWHAPGTGLATPAANYPIGKFDLADLTGATPGETDDSYNTTFDRMLCAKVTTNGANVPSVTPLKNMAVLKAKSSKTTYESGSSWANVPGMNTTVNWARTPQVMLSAFSVDAGTYTESVVGSIGTIDRYLVWFKLLGYITDTGVTNFYLSGAYTLELRA